MEIGGVYFQDPFWLCAMMVGPLLILMAIFSQQDGGVLFPGVQRALDTPRGLRVRIRHLPLILAALALMISAIALARPQKGSVKESVTTEGVDIVVSLDVSGSMAAEDFQPRNRLAVAKEVVSDFIQKRQNDRIGLVVFAGRSLTKTPPTTDTAVLLRQLDDVQLKMLPDGTAIGAGLATALTRLRSSKAKSRVIVLVTDGSNNAGEIDPITAMELARAMTIRVYTIGVGRGGQVPIPVQVQDPFTGTISKRTMLKEVQIDEGLLKKIAAQTGGEFFRATDKASFQTIFKRIDQLEKSEIKSTTYRRYRELFYPLLGIAALLWIAAGVARLSGLRVAES